MLTDTFIRKTKTPTKPTKLSEDRGLYLLCAPSGGRWWRFKYRYAGKEKLLSLGTYPDVSLARAREAREIPGLRPALCVPADAPHSRGGGRG
jgi:hypothetical protein